MTLSDHRNRRLNRISFYRLMLLALPPFGLGSIFTIKHGITTPVLQLYGLNGGVASLAWIFGPLTGLVIAPIVGAMSDNCTSKYGRRRPYIFLGLLSTLVGCAVLAFTYAMGKYKTYVSFTSFAVIEIAIQVMMTPYRAFASDLVPESQQGVVQLLAVLFQVAVGFSGMGLMRLFWTGTDASELPFLIGTAMLINTILISATCFLTKETPLQRAEQDKVNHPINYLGPFVNSMNNIFKAIPNMGPRMNLICTIQFLSWIAFYAWFPTASTWFARNVFNGCTKSDPTCTEAGEALFQQGTLLYTLSGMSRSVLTATVILVFAVYMHFRPQFRTRLPYALGLLIGSIALILAKFGPGLPSVAFAIDLVMGIPRAATNSFPFAMVGRIHAEQIHSDVGRDFGIMNIFVSLAQFVITFVISGFRTWLGNEGLPWVLFIAGVSLGLASLLVLFLHEDPSRYDNATEEL